MRKEIVKVRRLVIVADEGWLNAIEEMTSYVEGGEVCFYEEYSEPFDYELEIEEFCKDCWSEVDECECEGEDDEGNS